MQPNPENEADIDARRPDLTVKVLDAYLTSLNSLEKDPDGTAGEAGRRLLAVPGAVRDKILERASGYLAGNQRVPC